MVLRCLLRATSPNKEVAASAHSVRFGERGTEAAPATSETLWDMCFQVGIENQATQIYRSRPHPLRYTSASLNTNKENHGLWVGWGMDGQMTFNSPPTDPTHREAEKP